MGHGAVSVARLTALLGSDPLVGRTFLLTGRLRDRVTSSFFCSQQVK